jgi:hypothetical protein
VPLDEAIGGRAGTLGELVAADQARVRAVFCRWKIRTDHAPQTVEAGE